MVDPPDKTMCLYKEGRTSISAAWMVLKTSSAMPEPSTLIRWGWNRASGASNRSPPTLMIRPSGSCFNDREGYFGGSPRRKRTIPFVPCRTRRERWSPGPAFVLFRCCSRCSRASPLTDGPSQNRQCDWRRSPSTGEAMVKKIQSINWEKNPRAKLCLTDKENRP